MPALCFTSKSPSSATNRAAGNVLDRVPFLFITNGQSHKQIAEDDNLERYRVGLALDGVFPAECLRDGPSGISDHL